MKILKSNEAFERINDELQFSYVKYFVQRDGVLYYGKWKNRYHPPSTLDQLEEVQQIQTNDRGPLIQPTWSTIYIKTPSLLSYVDGSDLEQQILREVTVCEILRNNPHPNLATYYGCQETNGRVSGLCFKRYTCTLLEKANPGHLNKEEFRLSGREHVGEAIRSCLDGILDGIRHLHSLGFVHNDINPANIMFDEDGGPVIIDFDSCRRIGESLKGTETKRTHQWHDPRVEMVVQVNDLDAWQVLRIWLMGGLEERFLFGS
ncbi:kinase-like protein [Aspergillus ibericus CBS 121593]|uniref:Kinase-like protein n=1 Tax=Aspergillus ibericus CBS 121593 TaxID=1448316 RepID=A0A395GXV6_9EURO|nr:kinase-like protein [Aspergillus ibericus CBS 121593]RAL00173.1 kinase-like protein [Aspergillus ibericus CBS 121593]